MPKSRENCKILVANTPMDTDKIKIFGARVKVDSLEAVQEIERAERDKMKKKCQRIIATGCNVFINRQLIYNYPEELFKEAGVLAIEHSDFDGRIVASESSKGGVSLAIEHFGSSTGGGEMIWVP